MASFSHQETQSSPAREIPRTSKTSSSSPHRRRRGAGATEEDGGVAATGFSAALHRAPPPPPPALLRRLGVKEATGVGKVKVMLRVAGAGEGPFSNGSQTFTLDKRKKQVTLYETPAAGAAPAPDDRKVGVAAPKMFAFDAIFSQDDSQTEICSSALTDVIHAVINGTDGCLFCFGHAGLGKSYTMLGRAEGAAAAGGGLGAMPCAISWLFRGISEQRHKCGTRFSVRVSAVELCTNTNQIRDLLAPYHNDSEQSPGVYLRDDPLFGTQLQNHSELRVHSAEKAAFYLDAALATRRPGKDEGRDSHLLYTLHLYQYSVGGKGAVAGGRSRLHLIDLGNSERGKSSGGIPLSGLGNILLAIFNGQRHLPYRDHNLTHVLRECLGSLTCHTAMIVHVSPKEQSYTDTLTTLQLASRIHRLRRRKLKFPAANNAGSGGSSGEDASKPSSSEPDPSSSDLSADTVIYVGPLDDATDGEHPPVYIPHINSGDNRCVMSKALRGSLADQKHKSSLTRVAEEKSPVHKMHSSPKSSPLKVNPLLATSHSPKHSPAHSANSKVIAKKNPTKSLTEDAKTKSPLHQSTTNASTSDEQWIDGPRISKSKIVEARHIIHESQQVKKRETWIDGPMHASGVPLQLGSVPSQVTSATLQSVSASLQAGTIPLQAGSALLQIGLLTSQGNENVGYGYMDNHKKSMIRKWVENQTCQINKSRHSSPTHKSQQPNYKEMTQFKTCDDNDANPKIEPPIKHAVKPLQVEESTIRTGLKAGSKAIGIAEETAESEPPEHTTPSRRTMLRKPSKPEIDEDDDSEELAEIPPALPLIQPLSSREVSMESLDSRLKQRMRMNDDVTIASNHSREVDQNGTNKGPVEEEDEILEIIEVDEPLEPVPTQDSCLQVTEEDIALCMGYENPLPEVDQSDSEEHPLRILSQENLTVVSTFTDSLSLYSDVERQIRSDAYLRRALDLYCADFDCSNLLDMDPYEAETVSRSKLDELLGLRELYRSHAALADAAAARTAPQHLQSLSMSNVREPEEFRGDGSVYSEPAYRPSDKICDSCKRTMSRPSSAAGHRDSYCREACDDGFGPFERYRDGGDATDARIASLRHPDGASDPNLREERRTPGSGAPAPPFREALKASLHLEVAGAGGAAGEARKPGKPDGYDSGHESTPRTGKHSPAATSRRAESGYDSVPRDSDASSLDSYPTRRAARAAAAAAAAAGGGKRATAAKYKQHHDRSFCSWLRNPFTCKYADTDPEISDF